MTRVFFFLAMMIALGTGGCASGGQPVVWRTAYPIDLRRGYVLDVRSDVPMPPDELQFMTQNIEQALGRVFLGAKDAADRYWVHVKIVKYDEGSKFARFMLAGLGQMYLDGQVQVDVGNPPVNVRVGRFEKNYSWGGVIGGSADMRTDVLSTVGDAIAKAVAAPATALQPPPDRAVNPHDHEPTPSQGPAATAAAQPAS